MLPILDKRDLVVWRALMVDWIEASRTSSQTSIKVTGVIPSSKKKGQGSIVGFLWLCNSEFINSRIDLPSLIFRNVSLKGITRGLISDNQHPFSPFFQPVTLNLILPLLGTRLSCSSSSAVFSKDSAGSPYFMKRFCIKPCSKNAIDGIQLKKFQSLLFGLRLVKQRIRCIL